MRVLHVPASVGGNPQGLARAERELGLDSISVVLEPGPFEYAADRVLREPGVGRARFEARRLRLFLDALHDFDVIHFNFGRGILPRQLGALDLALLRRAGKVIAVTFQGDDARRGDLEQVDGDPSLPTALPERYPPAVNRERLRRVARFARYADLIFYLNPDLARFLPSRAEFVAYAHVDPREVKAATHPAREDFVIVHAPSDRLVKGTSHVIAAVDGLRSSGLPVELDLVEGLSHRLALERYAQADLAVDQLHAGWYGGFAVEVMALGVPVVSYIRERDLGVVDPRMRSDLPVLSARPETLRDVLVTMVRAGPESLADARRRARAYVEAWHDPLRIAATMRERYEAAAATHGRRHEA